MTEIIQIPPEVIVIETSPPLVIDLVEIQQPISIELYNALIGPVGPQGPPGPLGGDHHYVHEQMVPSAVWEVTHNMGKFPSVQVINNFNEVVVGDILFVDDLSVVISFAGPFSGKAIFN